MNKLIGPLFAELGFEHVQRRIPMGRVDIVRLVSLQHLLRSIGCSLLRIHQIHIRVKVLCKGGRQGIRDYGFIFESGKQHLFRKELILIVESFAHVALQGWILIPNGLHEVLVLGRMLFFRLLDWLKVDDCQMFLTPMELQQINPQQGEVVFRSWVPQTIEYLCLRTSVVIRHADLSKLRRGKAPVGDSDILLVADRDGEILGPLFVRHGHGL
mmetsp:Transcript_30801/g.50874  ORF Transcript_30801/g.50874 Transcript_30801/m.50874 type:complete len:213 (+) Transcript_30801:111-749(+)